MSLDRRPVVVFAVCWTLGYVIAYHWQPAWLHLYTSLLCGLLLCAVWAWKPASGVWHVGRTVLAVLFILTASAGVYADYDRANQTTVTIAQEESPVILSGRIAGPVKVDGDRASFVVEAGEQDWSKEGEQFQVFVRLMKQEEQETSAGWQRGDLVQIEGTLKRPAEARNFGAFDYRQYLRFKHIHWQLNAKGADSVQVMPPAEGEWGVWRLLRWNDQFREQVAERISRLFPQDQSGLVASMLIGVRDGNDPEQFQQFSRLGLTHIMAISGLHAAIFLSCLMWILKRAGLTRETSLLIGMVLVPLYVIVTGAAPSIVRAGTMAVIGLYAAYRNRLKDGIHVAVLTGTAMLMFNPYYLTDVSFQLSFLVTLGLIVLVPVVNRTLPIAHTTVRDSVSITVVAELVSFPLSIFYFNQYSLMSLPANLLLVPVFSLLVIPGGMIAVIVSLLWIKAGEAAAWVVARATDAVLAAAKFFDSFHFVLMIWPSPDPLWILAYYGIVIGLLYSLPTWRKGDGGSLSEEPMLDPVRSPGLERWLRPLRGPLLPVVSAAGLVFLLIYGYDPDRFGKEGHVQFIDVGQGDSILIRTPLSRQYMLIDGGGTMSFAKPGDEWKARRDPYEVGRKLLVPLLKQRGVQTIDYMLLTHQDTDHSGGLQAVLETIPVKRLLFNGTIKPTPGIEKLFQTALDKGVKLIPVYAGDTMPLDTLTELQFLHPLPPERRDQIKLETDQNPVSVVFHMQMAGTGWLFTGDIDQATELKLLENRLSQYPEDTAIPEVDVMKVAHHGSKSSTSELWLNAWKPKLAVISAGVNNVYGHPSPVVLDRLQAYGLAVKRTDAHGEVQAVVRDGELYVRTKLE